MPSPLRLSSRPPACDGQEVVVGVDTHKDFHVAAVITALGVLLASKTFPTTRTGYQALVTWARGFGVVRRAGVECTGSYGAALARHLTAADVEVFEVNQPDKVNRRRRGKNDAIDAESAARSVLNGQASALAKGGQGPVEMLRMFKVAKTSAVKSRTQAINQLKAVLVSADPILRDELRELSTRQARAAVHRMGAPHTMRQRYGHPIHPASARMPDRPAQPGDLRPQHSDHRSPGRPQPRHGQHLRSRTRHGGHPPHRRR